MISPEEALAYIQTHYTSTDPLRIQWEAMSKEDQSVYLLRAYEYINSLPYTGKPASKNQKGAFPRAGNFTSEDLLKVKYAQAEQALTFSDIVATQEYSDRMRLQRAGVTSYRIGDLSETFQKGSASDLGDFRDLSTKAFSYLSKWLRGGYDICTSIKRPHGCVKII